MLPLRCEEESGAQVESASERFGSMWACGTPALRRNEAREYGGNAILGVTVTKRRDESCTVDPGGDSLRTHKLV